MSASPLSLDSLVVEVVEAEDERDTEGKKRARAGDVVIGKGSM